MPEPARCEVIPLPENQYSFRIDGFEKTRWIAGTDAPRPYFYPLNGPSGNTLTRMGHPGAANHDHHRSVWFAHHKVLGIDFWSDNTEARIQQRQWFVISDGNENATLAVELGWYGWSRSPTTDDSGIDHNNHSPRQRRVHARPAIDISSAGC